ncbi:pyrokinin-1 receptor isoform X2 [Topomyia yanbarensis]|uniref:pyrokinin-1 receptor isoform X2 n=1 Tax=Topomyia yanbarensis TaxID=2498891 RepID=UPI00273B5B7F|nr:pyrokinin-1 receptor isoform X2 [Topomyia yanbarensis]
MNSTNTLDLAYADGSMLIDAALLNYGSMDENLTDIYGPKRDPLYVVVPVTIIYVLIFITGVIGNISTCIVISKNKSMHTATNYYLYSLAISDFLLLFSGVPQEIYFIWSKYPYIFGELFCIVRGIAAETSANATVLTITAFTIERYVAICHPFLSHTMSKLSRAVRFIFAIWIVAIVSAVPQALQFGVTNQSGVDQCVVKRIIIHHSFELSTFLFFFAPMTLITVLYALIGLKLRSSALMQRDGTLQRRNNAYPNNRQQGTSQGTRRVLKMLVAVVVAFFICWAPFHAQRLVYIYGVDKDHQPTDPLILKFFVVTTYVSGILYYLSTCINPLLYNIMSNKFRQAFKETLGNGCYFTRKSRCKERSYRTLCRRERHPTSNKESSEFSGNSIQDDSLYSSSTQKQSLDSIALSRGHSVKPYCQERATERENTRILLHPTKGMTLSAHLDLYTDEDDLPSHVSIHSSKTNTGHIFGGKS